LKEGAFVDNLDQLNKKIDGTKPFPLTGLT